jgi:pyruvate-formate lyase-activating enzyme
MSSDSVQSTAKSESTFCRFAFGHINLRVDGKASLCCRALNNVSDGTRDLSLHIETFDEIWNSAYMRDVRRRMVSGESVPACRGCYAVEQEGGLSLRQQANGPVFPTATFEEAARIVHHEEGIVPRPSSLHFWLGNLCNLKCRMCSGVLSSQIAGDLVHSKWSGGPSPSVTLLPRFLHGVDYAGFGTMQDHGGRIHRLLAPHQTGLITLPSSENSMSSIEIAGFAAGSLPCTLVMTIGNMVLTRILNEQEWRFDVGFEATEDFPSSISIGLRYDESGTIVGIRDLTLRGTPSLGKPHLPEFVSRLPENPAWYANRKVIFDEILAKPENLTFIDFAGGEPMLHEHLEGILRLLVERRLAKNIGLCFSTNGTVKSPKILPLLKEFRRVELQVSVDGVGALHEYIRYPSRWNAVLDNICRYNEELPGSILLQPTPQAYNFYGLVDLAKFCDASEFNMILNNVLYGPRYLSFEILPQSVIDEGIQEWELYRRISVRPHMQSEIDRIIGALRRPRPDDIEQLQDTFIRFTNDLDKSRNQSFSRANPRLFARLIDEGFDFENKFRFA